MSEVLSIFVDESGDFGCYDYRCPYYIVTLILHEQKYDISEKVTALNLSLDDTLIGRHTIHSGPLIRRESIYADYSVHDRIKIFDKLFYFTRKVNIKYQNIIVEKKHTESPLDINNKISKQLSSIVKDNLSYFQNFDKILIYYDNGQMPLANILVSIFSSWFHDKFEYRIVIPKQYKLFQTADLICTLSLIEHKIECGQVFTQSEKLFFDSYRNLKKNYLKHLKKLEF